MIIRKAFNYRLKTKPEQPLLRQLAGSCRFVWNKALALQKDRLDQGERCLSYAQMTALLPEWKREFPFEGSPFAAASADLEELGPGD